eukprot:scaffold476109_cov44-Prasinocladus_malaysianus.AAC.1
MPGPYMVACLGSTLGIVSSNAPVALLRVALLLSGNTCATKQKAEPSSTHPIQATVHSVRAAKIRQVECRECACLHPELELQQPALDEEPHVLRLHVRLDQRRVQ